MISIQKLAIASIIAIATITSCKKEDTTPVSPTTFDCTSTTPTYTIDVKPIMDNNCATSGCHSSSSRADGKDYSSYTAVKNGSSSNSFMGSIQHLSGYKAMPQGKSKLSDAQIKTISCWIENGKPQ